MSRRSPNRLFILGFVALVMIVAVPLRADVIHLKNGRTIRATRTEVHDDKLVFFQNGSRVEVPMAIVERIEEEAATPIDPTEPVERDSAEAGPRVDDLDDADAEEAADEGEEEEIAPESTREYWQAQVLAIEDEREQLQQSLVELRREERAFLFSHRSTESTRAKIDAVNQQLEALDAAMDELRREARRLQVPPGWLRVTVRRDDW